MAAMHQESAVDLLEENSVEVKQSVMKLLLQIADNIINFPEDSKFRRLRLSNKNISDKLLPAIGAIECLFEMGFEEAEDSFVLSSSTSLSQLKKIREKLAQKIGTQNSSKQLARPLIAPPSSPSKAQNDFLYKIELTSKSALLYEDEFLQKKAKACVPEDDLWLKAQSHLRNKQYEKISAADAENQGMYDLMLIELLLWFKHVFFKWVDKPSCQFCTSNTSFIGLSADPTHLSESPRTELYSCTQGHITPFHRYTHPGKLLETREGRCGEWANCFTLICRALGLDARIVYDETDHVWTEVWSVTQNRWLHCDSCEAICDAPLTYQAGWGKKLTYVMAYSRDDVQDVTWRYTQEPAAVVLARRNLCTEDRLLEVIFRVRNKLQASVSPARKRFLRHRLNVELISFLQVPGQQRVLSVAETQGRQSGSKEWRLQRKEIHEMNPGWIWKPTVEELTTGNMVVKYSSAQNLYQRSSKEQILQGWSRGVFRASNIAHKEERDWKKSYLARTEGSIDSGWVEWKFEMPAGVEVGQIQLQLESAVYSSGQVQWLLLGDKPDLVLKVTPDKLPFSSNAMQGCRSVTLRAELSGGEGSIAWQHTQLARQELNDPSFPLQVTIAFKSV